LVHENAVPWLNRAVPPIHVSPAMDWPRGGNHFVVTFDDRGRVPTVPFDGAVAFDGRGGVAAVPFNGTVTFSGGGFHAMAQ